MVAKRVQVELVLMRRADKESAAMMNYEEDMVSAGVLFLAIVGTFEPSVLLVRARCFGASIILVRFSYAQLVVDTSIFVGSLSRATSPTPFMFEPAFSNVTGDRKSVV